MVNKSELGVNQTLKELGIHKSTFYNWYHAYSEKGIDGLQPSLSKSRQQWNTIPQEEKNLVIDLALEHTDLSARQLACKMTDEQQIFMSESSVYRILKNHGLITTPPYVIDFAAKEFAQKTVFVNELWQTDFTYFKIIGWGWYYLSTILDDRSRYIVHWELCETMKAEDVMQTVANALKKADIGTKRCPRLLSDNGSCYVSSELKKYLKSEDIESIHGRPLHPQTQGKIERYHRSMKNVVKLENYYIPQQLRDAIEKFVHYYNNERYHESLDNLTPADVYFGRGELILRERERIKKMTLERRRLSYLLSQNPYHLKTKNFFV